MAKEKIKKEDLIEMTLEQSRAYRASLYKPVPKVLSEEQKREAFRIFWASQKAKYGKSKQLEKVLWLHLKTIGCDDPNNFEKGIFHFGLIKT